MEYSPIDTATAVAARFAISCDLAPLAQAVDYLARRVTERRNSIPILSCILIRADIAGTVTLEATDSDLWATVTIRADVEQPGALAINADVLRDTLAKAGKGRKDAQVSLRDVGGRAEIKSGRNRVALKTDSPDNFPALTLSADPIAFALPAAQFLADLAAVGSCASKEETRYYLNGAALQVRELAGQDRLCLVATDGNAIAVASRPIPIGATGLVDTIIHSKTMALIGHAAKLAGDADAVQVAAYGGGLGSSPKLVFTFGAVRIVAKAIDGTYPDWERPFADNLAATDVSPALFPELLPGAPVATIDKIAKAAKGLAIDWQPARLGMVGTVAGDPGLLFGSMNIRDADGCQRKGFDYRWNGEAEARAYLEALAESRGLRSAADVQAECIAINDASDGLERSQWLAIANGEAPGERAIYCTPRLHKEGTRVVGLTVSGERRRTSWRETVTDWERLCEQEVYHPEQVDPIEGSYSILMPADGPGQLVPESSIIGPDGIEYPVAMSDSAIHLSKEQVRALVGESCFEVMAVPLAKGHPLLRHFPVGTAYVTRWTYEQGDSRLLCVKRDGRCFDYRAGGERSYLSRADVDALIAGTWIPETGGDYAEPMPEPAAVECEASEAPEPIAIACQSSEAVERGDRVALDRGEQADAPCEAVSAPDELSDASVKLPEPDLAAMVADLAARVAAIEGLSAVSTLSQFAVAVEEVRADNPPIVKPARIPAHERAVRRAWVERKARRAQSDLDRRALIAAGEYCRMLESQRDTAVGRIDGLEACIITRERHERDLVASIYAERAKRRRAVTLARQRGGQMVALAGMVKQGQAALADLKRKMADPTSPERGSDIARLVGERDQARNANAALEQRCARMQSAVDQCAGTIESLASRVAVAEAALRKAA